MRNLLRLCPLLLAAALLFGAAPAFAGKRVALVIANSAYQHAPSLVNPVNDGSVMARTLKDAGFEIVDSRHDLSALDTRRVLREFADATRDADIAVVYYAGHGIEVEGSNYLIPVDAKLERDTDVFDEALSLDRVLVAVEPAKQLRLVILDACRDNPFGKTMKRTVASRGIGRGLAQVEPNSPNTLIAYSAKAGFTAQDGDGANSPFTVALSKHLTTPGLDVRRAFGFVRDDVLKSTGNKQEPFVYGSLGGEDVPLVPVKVAAAAAPAPNPQADIRRDYELALQVGSRPAWEAFLAQHSDGFYASLARLQVEKIGAEQAHAAATEKAKQAEAERDRLAAVGAQKDTQAKAAADAKAAEQAQLAAQKAKEQAQQQAAAAEQQRVNLATAAPNAAPSSTAASAGINVASLTPATAPADLSRSVQTELGRVGCFSGQADGNWNTSSQRSLSQFNRYAGTKLDVKMASTDALDTVKSKPSRVCPLACERGFKAEGDKCTRIVCGDGYALNDDNECEKKRAAKPTASKPATSRRDDSEDRPARQRRQAGGYGGMGGIGAAAGAGRAAGGGQVFCNNGGCRPVNRGCHLEYRGGGGPGNDANVEVCH
ncbi:caspase domain-containing protein [Bradyrhizobium cosmicum]|uniref:caspase family protein n=1 Tax=Bradyrhizobium cosmicum TaxID=1404864 RepID=UPI0028E306C0|nr:caspase family protein [Bradyrhizobium cosmicum]